MMVGRVKASGLCYLVLLCLTLVTHVSAHHEEEEEQSENRGEYEKRLLFDLFEKNGYNPLIRPVVNESDTLMIRFNLALSQIINMDEVNQVMKTNVWLQLYWHDYQLQWDPALYGNIASIRIRPDKLWTPDFVLFNNADGNFEVTYKSNCVLYSSSEVNWIPPAIYHSSCSIDVKYFPFDQQKCQMKFGSWTHKGTSLKYSFDKDRDKLDLVDYLKSGSWDIIDCPGKIVPFTDETTGDQKEQIIFEFVLRRKTLFYTVNLIIPCVLISFVTSCVFALPAHGGQKITLCISVLFALVVFLLLVSKILPPSLTIPLIAKYLLFTFLMNVIAIFATVVIINRNWITPSTQEMPYWVRVVFLRELPKYLLMARPDYQRRWRGPTNPEHNIIQRIPDTQHIGVASSDDDDEVFELSAGHSPRPQRNRQDDRQGQHTVGGAMGMSERSRDQGELGLGVKPFEMTPELRNTLESVKFIYQHLKQEQEYVLILEDWKYVARVMDRLLLIIFLLVTLSGTAGILINAPHILEFVDQDKIIKELVDYIKSKQQA